MKLTYLCYHPVSELPISIIFNLSLQYWTISKSLLIVELLSVHKTHTTDTSIEYYTGQYKTVYIMYICTTTHGKLYVYKTFFEMF